MIILLACYHVLRFSACCIMWLQGQ